MTQNVESGLRNYRIDFAREDEWAQFPENPEFLLYSGVVTLFEWESDSEPEPRRGLGEVNPVIFQKGAEEHTITLEYDMNKWFTQGGNPYDASYDAFIRDSDNQIPNSHTIVGREHKSVISEESTIDGESGPRGTRIYTVGKGGYIDTAEIEGSADDLTVLMVELEYMLHKVRSYQIDQPSEPTELAIQSTDASDTTQEVTLEDESGATSVTLTLDGTTPVPTTGDTFEDLDVIMLSEQTQGDVEVYAYDSDTTQEQLSVINGVNAYDGDEGDLGIPAVGTGSREDETDLPAEYQTFVGSAIHRGTDPFIHEIPSATLIVENEIEDVERTETFGMGLYPGIQDLQMEAEMFGEKATHELVMDHLQNHSDDVSWNLAGGTVTLGDAVLAEPGARAAEEGEAVMITDNVFHGQSITVGEN